MSLKIQRTGVFFDEKAIMEELDKRFSKRKMIQIYDKALIAAGNEVLKAVKANIRYFRDTGAEYGEAKLSKPEWEKGLRSVRVYWEGPQHRYSVVHLNEKGFYARNGKFIRPKGMGAIDNAIRSSRQTFYKVVEQEVSKLL
ncbi:hypothetical protein [Staphylococcus chromogenes]|uniref:hypothetical protein n=1 Tax=Staphylococcus chromogenes TaxID=46126 RepID=UPI001F270A78|nr:hypothetical protein [Staphylococcus chromogenes]